jgi:hypothetical protein
LLAVSAVAALAVASSTCGSSPTQPEPPPPPTACTYQVTASSGSFGVDGGTASITVSTAAGCAWTARSETAWVTIQSGGSGSGPGTFAVRIAANADTAAREASVIVADQSVKFTQAGREACTYTIAPDVAGQNVWVTQEGCRYSVYPGTIAVGAAGGSHSVNVLTQPISASCPLGCSWSAESTVSWIVVASGSPGAGDDRFRIEVAPNSGAARSGTVRVGGQTVTIAQARS